MNRDPRTMRLIVSRTVDASRIEVVDDVMAEVLRQKTPAERVAIGQGIWNSANRMIVGILKGQHPEWTDELIQIEAARRLSHGAA
jgi:hypothetical protein